MRKMLALALVASLVDPAVRAASPASVGPAPTVGPQASLAIIIKARVVHSSLVDGRRQVRLVPADRVVVGDPVVYSLAVHNEGLRPANGVVVTSPIPGRMRYLGGTAVGPGAQVSFSVDGGRTYGQPQTLRVPGVRGGLRRALPADYTDIRWILQDTLQPGSVAFVRFTAVLR